MDQETKRLAEQMLDSYGESALDDRTRIAEWLADHGLAHDERDVIAFERHMRWLWQE